MSTKGSEKGLCPDWLFSNTSNVHVARDREWFTEYYPWNSIASDPFGGALAVVGIGMVELSLKRSPKRSGPRAHAKLRLQNVLHVPTSICNVLGGLASDCPDISLKAMGNGLGGVLTDTSGRQIAYLSPHEYRGLPLLKLSGPPVGPRVGLSGFGRDPDVNYWIRVTWSASEREKWAAYQQNMPDPCDAAKSCFESMATTSEPYTADEKSWLRKHWGGEFKFLLAHGLNIHKDEDREEGQRMVRATMANGDENDGEAELSQNAWDPQGHFADHHFSGEELEIIERGWATFENFMLSFGLKFYKDEDFREAKAIVRGMMDHEKDED
ncbi:hypothetical protein MFIFM68171_09460 [Madurella fahalii]|uniref:Uncharacterized protein n=1 Tax=Madurella fahalii TaxID=1157608 RepID=A0ABQ0GNC0_9PEZI